MQRLCIGILAHVDAGKTTLSEGILFKSGRIRRAGRVDHGDAYLDTDRMEKERGITIFSKQAEFDLGETRVTLLDTPGHVDFSAEMERVLSVLDYAILVISGKDGVQGHTETLWRLLKRYHIPAFIFVNKMDQPGTDRNALLSELKRKLTGGAVDFTEVRACAQQEGPSASGDAKEGEERLCGTGAAEGDAAVSLQDAILEDIASCDERLLERYLNGDAAGIRVKDIRNLIWDRHLYPVYFGSALKLAGIDAFLRGFMDFTECPKYPEAFGAHVFKIARDEQNSRLTYMKITGGVLRARDELVPGEKVSQIRFYSGAKFETADSAEAGAVCAVTGISMLHAGDTLGVEPAGKDASLRPVLDYQILSEDADSVELYRKLLTLAPEFPELHLSLGSAAAGENGVRRAESAAPEAHVPAQTGEASSEIHVHLMGDVQTEILQRIIRERLGISVTFGAGRILYQETIQSPVEGIGHFEPLRHYAEVHLLMEPLPRGMGLEFRTDCSEDMLARNWQRLILTHLKEKEHVGVLTGSPVTDMRITVVAGRAHQKHTEGGDFREATYRAVRQGLCEAENVLLEPYYDFTLELPSTFVGRAMTDINQMHGRFDPPETGTETTVLHGRAPVSAMRDYHRAVTIYTKGRGRLFLTLSGYDRCHNAEEVIAEMHYDPEADLLNPSSSVFCAHGAGFTVPFSEVPQYMHVESGLKLTAPAEHRDFEKDAERLLRQQTEKADFRTSGHYIGDRELEEIFVRTYGPIRSRAAEANAAASRTVHAGKTDKPYVYKEKPVQHKYLLVDGYNIIFAFAELNDLAKANLDAARVRLLDMMSNYAGFTGKRVIVVFDAYRVQGHQVEQLRYHNIYEVFTKEAMTADEYIEELTHELGHRYQVEVATSDQVVQVITFGAGAALLSAGDLEEELRRISTEIRTEHLDRIAFPKEHLGERLDLPEIRPES